MKLKGKDINILLNGVIVAVSTSCEIDKSCDIIERASASSGKAKSFVAGRTSWSVNLSKFVEVAGSDLLRVGETYTLKVQVEGTSDYQTGTAICQNCHITAQKGHLCSGTLSFQGSGELS